MVSFDVRQMPLIAALAASAAPCVSLSQPDAVAVDEQGRLVARIETAQAQDGPYAIELLDPLAELSLLYQDGGDHGLALIVLEQARQVVRANYGLRSLEQAPLMRRQVFNEEARGNVERAWNLEHELLALVRGHPNDLRTVPIFRELGDKRMAILDRYLAGELPPQIELGCYYNGSLEDGFRNCGAGSRGVVVRSLLREAWRYYDEAIGVLARNERYGDDELRELEMRLIRSSYAHQAFGVGRRSVRRLLSYEVAAQTPVSSQIEALIQLADWDLLSHKDKGVPLDLYAQTYELMTANGIARQTIDRTFSPEIPIVLPTFLPNPLVTTSAGESAGHIDVRFELTKFGESRDVEIVDASANVTDEDKDRLVTLIHRSRFRPQVTDGQFVRTAPIDLRYHLDE